jgi:hypothetical protein
MPYKWHKTVRIFDFAKISFNEKVQELIYEQNIHKLIIEKKTKMRYNIFIN